MKAGWIFILLIGVLSLHCAGKEEPVADGNAVVLTLISKSYDAADDFASGVSSLVDKELRRSNIFHKILHRKDRGDYIVEIHYSPNKKGEKALTAKEKQTIKIIVDDADEYSLAIKVSHVAFK